MPGTQLHPSFLGNSDLPVYPNLYPNLDDIDIGRSPLYPEISEAKTNEIGLKRIQASGEHGSKGRRFAIGSLLGGVIGLVSVFTFIAPTSTLLKITVILTTTLLGGRLFSKR